MAQVQALVILASDDRRTITLARCVGEMTAVEMDAAVMMVEGQEVRVPVHLVRGLDRPDVLRSAVAQLSAEVLDDRACLYAAVGEVIERAERTETGEYAVPGEDHERMVDAWARIPANKWAV